VIGCGGIMTAEDALEFLVVGCRAVQLGTVNFSDPGLVGRLADDMSSLLDGAGVRTLDEVIGTLRLPEPPAGKGR
jgi:dihydroorotate dehydrogenase (NAD+) catalytic subunit